jgi:hypothetical protein
VGRFRGTTVTAKSADPRTAVRCPVICGGISTTSSPAWSARWATSHPLHRSWRQPDETDMNAAGGPPFRMKVHSVTGRTAGRASTGVCGSNGAVCCWRTRRGLKGLPSLCDLET